MNSGIKSENKYYKIVIKRAEEHFGPLEKSNESKSTEVAY